MLFMSNPRPGEGLCVLGERGSRLSEMMCCSHYFRLAQARWISLSEADGLAWANTVGLSKNVENPCLRVLFELFCLMFPKLWKVYTCFVVFGLEGLSP